MKTIAVILLVFFSTAAKAQIQAVAGGKLGIEPAPGMSSEEAIRWIAAQHDKWAKLIRAKGIRAE